MSFSLVNPTGWSTGDLLTDTQINQLDEDHASAIDGAGGGTYTLTAPLAIQGDTVNITDLIAGDLTISDDLIVTDDVSIGGDCQVTGTLNCSSCSSNWTIPGNLTVQGSANLGNASGDIITSVGQFSTSSFFTANSSATFNADVTLGNAVSDSVTLNSIMAIGTGRIRETGIVLTGAGDQSVEARDYRNIYLSSGITGSNTYTVNFTGAADGDWFVVQNDDSSSQSIAGVVSATLSSGDGRKYLLISGTWRSVMAWKSV
jgi:hypothetical protein